MTWRTQTLRMNDGTAVRVGSFGTDQGRPDCVFLPGLGDFLEKRTAIAERLEREGYRTFSLDWRGQGRSQRLGRHPKAAHLNGYDDLLADIDSLLEWRADERPFWLLGYSMGGTAALLWRQGREAVPAMLISPMLAMRLPMSEGLVLTLAKGARYIGRSQAFASGETASDPMEWTFDDNTITDDAARYEELKGLLARHEGALVTGTTWGWVEASIIAMRRARSTKLARPERVLFVLAAGDRSVDPDGSFDFATASGAPILRLNGNHDLFLSGATSEEELWTELLRHLRSVTADEGTGGLRT